MIKHPNLKIIADDLGLSKSVNDGIIFLLRERKIYGASLMANGEAFDHALDILGDLPDANIGVHLVLVEERSLSKINLPRDHRIFFIKYVLGMIEPADIEQELKSQIDKIIQAGIRPGFINGHQHLHLLPGIMNICIKLAKERNIQYIRIVNEPVVLSGGKLFRKFQLLFLNFLSTAAKKKIRRAGLQCNDYFVGFVNAGSLNKNDMKEGKKLAEEYPDKIIELGCHPGHEDEELKGKYGHWENYNWQKEKELLLENNENFLL